MRIPAFLVSAAILVLAAGLIASPALAGYGISPSGGTFHIPVDKPGTFNVSVDNSDGAPAAFRISVSGSAAGFSKVDSPAFTVNPSSYKTITVTITPPRGTKDGDTYSLELLLRSDSSAGGQASSSGSGGAGFQQVLISAYTVRFGTGNTTQVKTTPFAGVSLPSFFTPVTVLIGGVSILVLSVIATIMVLASSKK